MQIYAEARKYAYGTGVRTVVVYGGAEMRNQFFDLERVRISQIVVCLCADTIKMKSAALLRSFQGCDICVATPGRLSDLIKRQKIFLKLIK